jgi:hypothetical protein
VAVVLAAPLLRPSFEEEEEEEEIITCLAPRASERMMPVVRREEGRFICEGERRGEREINKCEYMSQCVYV